MLGKQQPAFEYEAPCHTRTSFDVPHTDTTLNQCEEELELALKQLDAKLKALLQRDASTLEVGDVLGIAEEEMNAGNVLGGDSNGARHVWLDDNGNLRHNVPDTNWLPTLRFPRVQQKADTSYEVRPIEDCTGSGLTPTVTVIDRMVMESLDTFVDSAHYITTLWPPNAHTSPPVPGAANDDYKPVWAKGDHEKAHREWPVHPDDQPLVATLVWDKRKECFSSLRTFGIAVRGSGGGIALHTHRPGRCA